MFYPVVIEPDQPGFMASFPDIPEALTGGETEAETLAMARDALIAAMDFYFEDRRPVPMPSKPKRGQQVVELPASVWAKVLLLNEMLAQDVKPSELARRLNTRPQDINRVIDLNHSTKIDTIQEALATLGKHLIIGIQS